MGHQVSRRKIARIMKENALISNYTVAQYKVQSKGCNESKTDKIDDILESFEIRRSLSRKGNPYECEAYL